MSIIFNPLDSRVPPQYFDGVENLLTKGQGGSTSSLSFAALATTNLVVNLFADPRNNSRVKIEYVGRVIGLAGTKQLRCVVAGAPLLAATFTTSNTQWRVELLVAYRNGLIMASSSIIFGPGGTPSATEVLGSLAPTAFDPLQSAQVVLEGLVANAADQLVCDWFGASFR